MNNKKLFLKKVKRVIKEVGFEENIMYTSLMLEMSGETISDLQSMKGEINDLCNFLNGEEAFDERYMGATVFMLNDFLELAIELNKENETRMNLLMCVKRGIIFVKDLFEECIDEEIWHQLLAKQALAIEVFVASRKAIESNIEAA
jgi:hypothetical protein